MNIYDKTSTMDYFRIQSEMNSPILTFVRTSSKDPNTWCISLIRKKNRPKKLKMVENSSSVWTSKNWKIGRSLIFPTLVHLTCMFLASKSVIYVQILWLQKVVSNVYLQKEFTKLDILPHAFPKNVLYIVFCLNCLIQGVRSTVDWKPRLQNYKSHINKKCDLVALLITLLMFVVTKMIPQEILHLLLLIN